MDVNKHICFRADEEHRLISFLRDNGIPYIQGDIITTIDISQSSIHWPFISEYISERKLLCLSNTVYTESELLNAQWLAVRSQWRCGYPQPEKSFKYEQITYGSNSYCSHCGSGLIQTSEFRVKKTPNWGKRHFMMLNWVEDELFLDDKAKEVLENAGLTGFCFRQVLNKSGKSILPNINQLIISDTLPPGLIPNEPVVDQIVSCEVCGYVKYHTSGIGMLKYRREAFDMASDVVKSAEIFGWGRAASRLIFVSQKVYQTITQNHFSRGLDFSPLELI